MSSYGGYGGGGTSAYETAIRQREQSYSQPQGFRQQLSQRRPQMEPTRSPLLSRPPSSPPPAPVYTGRMQVNGMGTQGGGMGITPPQTQGGGLLGGVRQPQTSGFDQQILQLPPEMQERLNEFNESLYTGPDYKGRHEAAQMLKAQYARMLMGQDAQPDIDFSGSSEVADQFNNQRERLTADLGARGFGGSGIEAGALANSYGSQARAQGSFYRDAMEQRRREELQQQMAFENWARGIEQQGLTRNWAEQDAPSFLDKALGVVGGIGGTVIGGMLGGPMGAGIGNQIGSGLTGGQPQQTYYGPHNQFGYGNQYDNSDYDYGDQFGGGR